jgi:hypothetical protein
LIFLILPMVRILPSNIFLQSTIICNTIGTCSSNSNAITQIASWNFCTRQNFYLVSRAILAIAFFVLCHFQGVAQTEKRHFTLSKLDSNVSLSAYEIALNEFGKLDQYRYLDKRRTILFSDKKVSVQLYSAKELFSLYQKRISPFTIKDETKATSIYLELCSDGVIREKFIKP